MADIVERLRTGYNPPAFWLEAADEIERLRADNAKAAKVIAHAAAALGTLSIGYGGHIASSALRRMEELAK